jgi:hypothetical protein
MDKSIKCARLSDASSNGLVSEAGVPRPSLLLEMVVPHSLGRPPPRLIFLEAFLLVSPRPHMNLSGDKMRIRASEWAKWWVCGQEIHWPWFVQGAIPKPPGRFRGGGSVQPTRCCGHEPVTTPPALGNPLFFSSPWGAVVICAAKWRMVQTNGGWRVVDNLNACASKFPSLWILITPHLPQVDGTRPGFFLHCAGEMDGSFLHLESVRLSYNRPRPLTLAPSYTCLAPSITFAPAAARRVTNFKYLGGNEKPYLQTPS